MKKFIQTGPIEKEKYIIQKRHPIPSQVTQSDIGKETMSFEKTVISQIISLNKIGAYKLWHYHLSSRQDI